MYGYKARAGDVFKIWASSRPKMLIIYDDTWAFGVRINGDGAESDESANKRTSDSATEFRSLEPGREMGNFSLICVLMWKGRKAILGFCCTKRRGDWYVDI